MKARYFLISCWMCDNEGTDNRVAFTIKSKTGHFVSLGDIDKIVKAEFPDVAYVSITNIMEFKNKQDYLDFGAVDDEPDDEPFKNFL